MRIIKTKTYEELSLEAANIIRSVIILNPFAVVGLATGSTPIGTYKKLIEWYNKKEIDFKNISTINLDEYVGISYDDKCSYHHFMEENLFDKINVNKENTYIPNGMSNDLKNECEKYDNIINSKVRIDVQLLGIGENGHIGFNEPSDEFIYDTHIVDLTLDTINANKRFFDDESKVPKKAITMGIGPIVNSNIPLLLASGKNKSDAIEKMVKGQISSKCPASILGLNKNTIVIVDEEAGSKI